MNSNNENYKQEYYDEYEIDLREYILLIWNHKWFITAFVVLAVLAAFVFSSYFIEPVYRTDAVVSVPNYELVNGQIINKEDFVLLFESDEVMSEIIKFINQDIDNNQINNAELSEKINFNIGEENNNQINIALSYYNPEKAAEILDRWINVFISHTKELINRENTEYIKGLKNKAEQDYFEYKEKLSKLSKFNSNNNLSLMKKDINSKENRLIALERRNNNFKIELESKKTELAFIEEELEEVDQFLIRRNLINDEFLQKLKTIYPDNNFINLLNTEEEFLNPHYQELVSQKSKINSRIHVLNTEISLNEQEIVSLNNEIGKLQNNYHMLNQEEEILNNELNNSNKVYLNSEDDYSNAEQELANKNYNIYVFSSPKIMENPISPNIKLNTAIAAVLAFMLAVFIILFKEFMKEDE
jgi:capsular polysaccharide biosynthesis protein